MIAKHIPMKVAKKSNFGELAQYIANFQNKHERVEQIAVTNCHQNFYGHAVKEILAVQRRNTRAESDKTYHLMVSFPAGENPAPGILEKIESKVCDALGFGEHQRISAVHTDTDHLHMHIAINKIHPRRLTIHNPFCDHKALGIICDKLEIEYGLTHDNHQPVKRGAHSPALDMEHAAGIESLLGWIRRECLPEIRAAKSWEELHVALQRNGLAISEKGNGLVITDQEGRGVKPSSIARDLSRKRLEDRFGLFVQSASGPQPSAKTYRPRPMACGQDMAALYANYRLTQARLAESRAKDTLEARNKKNLLVEAAKNEARLKRTAIRLLAGGRLDKKMLYHLVSRTLRNKIQAVSEQYRAEHKVISTGSRRQTWLDWLQKRAIDGDKEALAALRARQGGHSLNGNVVSGETVRSEPPVSGLQPDSITKRGTVIYRVGASAIRDDGTHIKVSKTITQKALALSLHLAMRRFGPCIKVEGTAEFKERAVQLAVSAKLPLIFEDAALEHRRQALMSESQTLEKKREPAHRNRIASAARRPDRRSRSDRRGHDVDGYRPEHRSIHERFHKPNVARIGSQPPPQSQNHLRGLSELGMVHNAFRSEVLLPGHVPGYVEQQGAQPDNGLRRDAPESGRIGLSPGEEAVRKYIAERQEKGKYIKDIQKHTGYKAGQGGHAHYAGWRQIDGQPLLLLKSRESEIIVIPVDAATLSRVKRLKVGSEVIFNADGAVRKRGRSL